MSRPDVPADLESSTYRAASVHRSQADVVPEQEMHAEHMAALETTLFRASQPTLVLALESGSLRVLSEASG